MSSVTAVWALIAPAYLLGMFPTAALVARAGGHDIHAEGSGNPGASNVYRLMGFWPALVVFAGDLAKGAVPALAGVALWDHPGAFVLGATAVVGHVFPVVRRFRGGRGVSTAGGLAIVLYPWVSLGLVAGWIGIAHGLGRASLASLVVSVALPVAVWATGEAVWEVGALAGLAALVIVRHGSNLRRLLRGEELRLDPSRTGSVASGDESPPGTT